MGLRLVRVISPDTALAIPLGVIEGDRLAEPDTLVDRLVDVPDLGPAVAGGLAQSGRMLEAHDLGIAIVVDLDELGPQRMIMRKPFGRIRSTALLRLCGHVSSGPSGVAAQSCLWMRRDISPVPVGQSPGYAEVRLAVKVSSMGCLHVP
ncbi:hypothetical protein [Microvirga sp. TS319]|uniref:hypothetical protein n=1 Tax=Microvirga sp. TS319 TaxID=3241165 RepID=UPI003519F1E0